MTQLQKVQRAVFVGIFIAAVLAFLLPRLMTAHDQRQHDKYSQDWPRQAEDYNAYLELKGQRR